MPFASWGDTISAIQRRQTYDTQVQAAARNANPAMATQVVAHANAMPWASPQTAYVLAASGSTPGDPIQTAIATSTVNAKGGGFFHALGSVVDAGARAVIHAGSDVQHALKTTARVGFTAANALYELPVGAWRDIAAKGGDIVAGATGGGTIGAGVGLAGGPFSEISVPLGAGVGALIGGIAGAFGQAKGVKIQGSGSVNPLDQSAGGLALKNLLTGKAGDIDLGSGFMPGGKLSEQATKNMQAAANINGHALTPGRAVAAQVFTPGSTGYNVLSGMGDAITRWNLDPARYLGEEAGAQIREAKLIPGVSRAVEDVGRGNQAFADAGPLTKLGTRMGILDSAQPAFNEEVARNWLTTDPTARAFVAKATATDDASEIWRASNKKLPADLVNQLAAHTNEQDVVDTLVNAVGSQGLREQKALETGSGWLASTVSNTRVGARLAPVFDRITSVMPAHSVDLMDVDKPGGAAKLSNAMDQLDNLFTQARVPEAERAPYLNRLAASKTADEAQQVIRDAVHGDLRGRLLNLGMSEARVQSVLRTTAEDRNALLSQLHSEVAGNSSPKAVIIGQESLTPAERPGTFVPGQGGTLGRWEYQGAQAGGPVFEGPAQGTLSGAEQPGRFVAGKPGTPGQWVPGGSATGAPIFEETQTLFPDMARPGTVAQPILGEAETPGRFVPGEARTPSRIEPTGAAGTGKVFDEAAQPMLTGAEQPGTFVPGTAGTPSRWEYQGLAAADGPVFPVPNAADVLADEATHVRLPEGRDIRRMTTPSERMRQIYNSKAFLNTEHAADQFMGAWKKLNLPRVALMNRMVAMSQAKMGANGLETVLSDPLNQISMLIGRSARPAALEGLVEGTPLSQAEELLNYSRRLSGHYGADELAAFQRTLTPADEGFARSWAARVAEQHADPVARSIAANGVEDTVDSLANGPLALERQRLIAEHGLDELGSLQGVRDHVQNIADTLQALTVNDPRLMDAVASGRLAGVDVLAAHPGGLVNPQFEDALGKIVDGREIEVPNIMKAARPDELDPDYGVKIGRVTAGFYSLLGKSMDALVNHPAFNQLYWRAVADNAAGLSEEGRATLLARMGDDAVRMPKGTARSIAATLDASDLGAMTAADVDKLARGQAIQALQDMTIDMSKKQGWQDVTRHLFPFAKHWQQETGQWARLLTTHPEAFEKAQMVVHGGEGLAPTGGQGFFHKDANGNLVFNYPGSGLVSKVLTGVDMPMTGKLGGLSTMTTDIMPGFGPMVSIPAAKLIPNKPEFDSIRDFMSPYGDETAKGIVQGFLPAWAKTLQTALSDPANDRDAANTTMDVARYLVSTGKYSMDTPEEVTKTLEAAGARAKKILELQALGKFVLPASASLQPMAQDKDGRTVTAKLLSDDLIQMRKDDYDTSTEKFLDKYGDNALLFLQSSSRPLVAGAASTKEQEDFARTNPELAKAFPNSYAFFANQGDQTQDFNSITRQIHMGQRQSLTPQQQVAMANDQVGSMIYYQAKAKFGARISDPQQQWLNQLKQMLIEKYPGFGVPITGVGARVTDTAQGVTDVVIPEMRKALDNEKMAATDTGQALAQYMELRDGLDKIAQSRGLKAGAFTTATHAQDLRAVLNKAAGILAADSPGFSMLFDRLLSRELKTDTQPGATTATPGV